MARPQNYSQHIEITWKCEDLVEAALNEAAEAEEVLVEIERKVG